MSSLELQDIALQKGKMKNPGYRTMSRQDKMGCLMLWLKIKLEPSGGPKEGCQVGRTKEKGLENKRALLWEKKELHWYNRGGGHSCRTQGTWPKHPIFSGKECYPIRNKENDSKKVGFRFCRSLTEHRWKP